MKQIIWIYVSAVIFLLGLYGLRTDYAFGWLTLLAGGVAFWGWTMVVLFDGWIEVEERRVTPVVLDFFWTPGGNYVAYSRGMTPILRLCGRGLLPLFDLGSYTPEYPLKPLKIRLQISAVPLRPSRITNSRRAGSVLRALRLETWRLDPGLWVPEQGRGVMTHPEIIPALFQMFPHAFWSLTIYVKVLEVEYV